MRRGGMDHGIMGACMGNDCGATCDMVRQARWRGKHGRGDFAHLKQENRAAAKMQAGWRGRKGRMQFNEQNAKRTDEERRVQQMLHRWVAFEIRDSRFKIRDSRVKGAHNARNTRPVRTFELLSFQARLWLPHILAFSSCANACVCGPMRTHMTCIPHVGS